MIVCFEVRQKVRTVNKRWLVAVYSTIYDRAAEAEYARLVAAHPNEYFELVKITHHEDCVSFTALESEQS